MRTHPTDPRLYLVELTDFRADPLPPQVVEHLEPLRAIVHWAMDYLCNPHPELGRRGAVCPFTTPSIRRNLFYLTVMPGADLRQQDVVEMVRTYRDWFLEMEPHDQRSAQYKTITILFPDIPEEAWSSLIEATHEELKAEYVPHGIMLGEFHPGPPDKAALRNPDFRPLKSPVPLLGIRHMVPTDFAFLRDRRDFMAAYLARHGDKIDALPGTMSAEVRQVAADFGLELPGAPQTAPEDETALTTLGA
ncbi:MAG TPA: hypothetical protein VLK84_30595 [Longimicrobium sp.]|nr:hypothetical protein [Longimicrobium sp.]